MEAAHTPASLRAAARLACYELLRSGTTSILTMETVHDTDAVFEAVGRDRHPRDHRQVHDGRARRPARPRACRRTRSARSTRASTLAPAVARHRRTAASAPRSRRGSRCPARATLLEQVAALSTREHALVHTHASEQRDEIELVRRQTGSGEHRVPRSTVGLLSPRLNVAHCVWVERRGAGDAGGARRQGHPLPRLQPEARLGHRAGARDAGAAASACRSAATAPPATTTSTCSARCAWRPTLQAIRRGPGPCRRGRRSGWRRGTARAALGLEARNRLGRGGQAGRSHPGRRATPPHVAPDRRTPSRPSSTRRTAGDVRLTMVDGEILVRDGASVRLDRGGGRRRGTARSAVPWPRGPDYN